MKHGPIRVRLQQRSRQQTAKVAYFSSRFFAAPGGYFVSDFTGYYVRRVTPSGIISAYAGTRASAGYAGDGFPATAAGSE